LNRSTENSALIRLSAQVTQRFPSLVLAGVGPHGLGPDARPLEDAGHEAGVIDAHAEPESAHTVGRIDVLGHHLEHHLSPGVIRGDESSEPLHIVTSPADEWDFA
jgi:hypothetical protein